MPCILVIMEITSLSSTWVEMNTKLKKINVLILFVHVPEGPSAAAVKVKSKK